MKLPMLTMKNLGFTVLINWLWSVCYAMIGNVELYPEGKKEVVKAFKQAISFFIVFQ